MTLRKISEEVFIDEDPIVRLGDPEIALLKRQAQSSPRKRARICAHKSNDDTLHEMLIAIAAASYIHPHRHPAKSESFHIIEGEVDVVVFDDFGNIVDVVELGALGTGRRFFYRLCESAFHTLLLRSAMLVMHEVTNGPFSRDGTILAPFAPHENQTAAVTDYIARLSDQVAGHLRRLKA